MLQPMWQQAQKVMRVGWEVESKQALLALLVLVHEEIKQCCRVATAAAIVNSI